MVVTDKIIVISDQQKKDICSKYKVAAQGKVYVIPLGFDLAPFSQKSNDISYLRDRFVLKEKDQPFLVGIIGRLTPIKNHIMFLDVIRYLKDKGEINKFSFIIVGDGELRNYLEEYSVKLDIREYVTFSGW